MSEAPVLNTPLAAFVKPIFLKWEKLRLPYPCVIFFLPFAPMMGW